MGCKYLFTPQLERVEIRAWMSNYTPQFYVDVIVNPCLNPDTGQISFW